VWLRVQSGIVDELAERAFAAGRSEHIVRAASRAIHLVVEIVAGNNLPNVRGRLHVAIIESILEVAESRWCRTESSLSNFPSVPVLCSRCRWSESAGQSVEVFASSAPLLDFLHALSPALDFLIGRQHLP